MVNRSPLLVGVVALLLVAGGGGAWWWHGSVEAAAEADGDDLLPIPPIPPRIAEGADYERCLSMLNTDPTGAHAFADAWTATGGGEGAEHCLALATIQLGDVAEGADMLDTLANRSGASSTARASVYGQAGQAWLMAGDANRALGSTTLALSMAPDDPDLLIERAVASTALERFTDAVDDLTKALDMDGRRADALVLRAAAYRQLDHLDLAQDDVDRAYALDPDDPDTLLERGILRQRRGDRAGARQDWERVVTLSPDTGTGDLAQQNLALLDAGPERR